MEGNRIKRFGAHLPLSQERKGIENRGTRHAAALGLAERVDALCIVVSEQNGALSVAQQGVITALTHHRHLELILEVFLRQRTYTTRGQAFWSMATHRLWAKIAAIFIGSVLWLVMVQGFKPVERTFDVRVKTADVPENLRVVSIQPSEISVRVAGLSRNLERVGRPSINVSLAGTQAGVFKVPLQDSDIRLRGPVHLVSFEPEVVEVELSKTAHGTRYLSRKSPASTSSKKKRWIW
jgi:hypothetical protein